MPSSRGSSQPRDRTQVSYVYLHWQVGSLPLVSPGKPLPATRCIQPGEPVMHVGLVPDLIDSRDSSFPSLESHCPLDCELWF